MARRPANITQADIARAIRAAKQTGASEVVVHMGEKSKIVIRLGPSTETNAAALEQSGEIVL